VTINHERPVTLSVVARHARVSIATVSYVLNGVRQSRIPESTQTRVRDAARELGYVPNVSARSLRMGRSNLVIAHLPGGTRMLQHAAAGLDRLGVSLRDAGYTLLVHGDTSVSGVAAARLWSAMRPTAVITELALLDAPSLNILHAVGSVVIGIGDKLSATLPTLVFDDSMLGEVAVGHLIERGCRDICMILPKNARARLLSQHRHEGAKRALQAAKGVRFTTTKMADDHAEAAQLAAAWAKGPRPDGVFGFDDDHSGILLGALLDHGIRVPQELALIGADDDPVCQMLRPRLSSVAIDLDALRYSVAEPVIAAIRGTWTQSMGGRPWNALLRVRDT
jgi:DNA-binding LacI/PurR family transcriptional regulator